MTGSEAISPIQMTTLWEIACNPQRPISPEDMFPSAREHGR